jgi:hypothetical protein
LRWAVVPGRACEPAAGDLMGLQPLVYVVLAPIVGGMGPVAGCWVVRCMHAAEAAAQARAGAIRPCEYDWTRAVACLKDTVEREIRKGAQ